MTRFRGGQENQSGTIRRAPTVLRGRGDDQQPGVGLGVFHSLLPARHRAPDLIVLLCLAQFVAQRRCRSEPETCRLKGSTYSPIFQPLSPATAGVSSPL